MAGIQSNMGADQLKVLREWQQYNKDVPRPIEGRTFAGYAGEKIQNVKQSITDVGRALDPQVPMTTEELNRVALDVAGAVTLPTLGAKPGMTTARIGFSQARKNVLDGIDLRIAQQQEKLSKLAHPSTNNRYTRKIAQLEQTRKEYIEGFAAMPRAWTRKAESAEAVKQSDMGSPNHLGEFTRETKSIAFNMDRPDVAVIGHEFQHSVEQYLREMPFEQAQQSSSIVKEIWANQRFVDKAAKDFKERFPALTKKSDIWKHPTEYAAYELGDMFKKFYRKHGRRMTTQESARAVRDVQNQWIKRVRRERPDLYKQLIRNTTIKLES